MEREPLSVTLVLDKAAASVARTAAPWLGVLWLTELPLRLLQVHLWREAVALGGEVRHYGDYLGGLALLTAGAFVLSLYGRAVYVRALGLAAELGRSPGGKALATPAAGLVSYVYVALLLEVLFFMFIWSVVLPLVFVILAGLAAATSAGIERPGLVRPLKALTSALSGQKVLVTVPLVFVVGFALVWLNLYFLAQAALWLAQGAAAGSLEAWDHLLRPSWPLAFVPAEPLTALLILMLTCMLVEPFWLASHFQYVRALRMRETGEDLRQRFRRLAGGSS
jgi:hypothetical protein